jgi:hypothetical protein
MAVIKSIALIAYGTVAQSSFFLHNQIVRQSNHEEALYSQNRVMWNRTLDQITMMQP